MSHIFREEIVNYQLEIHLEFRSLSLSPWSKFYPDADFVGYPEGQSVSSIVHRHNKNAQKNFKKERESEELQMDKLMPGRKSAQDVGQAGRKVVETHWASISKYLRVGDRAKAARAVLKETCT